jgi:hypothetical protein
MILKKRYKLFVDHIPEVVAAINEFHHPTVEYPKKRGLFLTAQEETERKRFLDDAQVKAAANLNKLIPETWPELFHQPGASSWKAKVGLFGSHVATYYYVDITLSVKVEPVV